MAAPRQRSISGDPQHPRLIQDEYLNALAGATAGMAASLVVRRLPAYHICQCLASAQTHFLTLQVCPLDVVKTRLQGQVHSRGQILKYNGTFSTLGQIYREEGIRGCYRGLNPTLLGMVPTWATYFTSYNALKNRLEKMNFTQRSSNGQSLVHTISACGAGVLTATATNPIWVVKTRIQMTASEHCAYKGTIHAFKKIFREEGFKAFYKGLGPSLLGVSHITIQFPLYERLKHEMVACSPLDANGEHPHASIFQLISSAAVSKILASLFTYPHEVVRTRMYMDQQVAPKMLSVYLGLFREGGIPALYRGFVTNSFRVVPASAVTFVSYEIVYEWLNAIYGNGPPDVRSSASVKHKETVVAHHK